MIFTKTLPIAVRLRRWCSGIMQDSHSCDPGSIPGRRTAFWWWILCAWIPINNGRRKQSLKFKIISYNKIGVGMAIRIVNKILPRTGELRRWCSGIMQDSHSCDPGSIPGRRTLLRLLSTIYNTELHSELGLFSTALPYNVFPFNVWLEMNEEYFHLDISSSFQCILFVRWLLCGQIPGIVNDDHCFPISHRKTVIIEFLFCWVKINNYSLQLCVWFIDAVSSQDFNLQ